MIGHLKDRAAALAALGWTGDDAEWLAFVCLHSGAFLRSQYLNFIGSLHPSAASRFIDRCASIAVEEAWNGTPLKLCRITARPVYRALGAEHIRHRRRPSATGLLLRRLLAFDFVVDHADRPWLPTEDEKVAMLTAVGVPKAALPRRVYTAKDGRGKGQTRYFVHKLPVALDHSGSLFVYVQAGDESAAALRTWGDAHADLWATLLAKGRAVSVVVVGLGHDPLASADKVLSAWTAAGVGAAGGAAAAELADVIEAIDAGDAKRLAKYGGPQAALDRYAELEGVGAGRATARTSGSGTPGITSGAVWRSARVLT